MNVLYVNGQRTHPDRGISFYNPTFLYGINCFEGIRAYWDATSEAMKVLDLAPHLDRLYASAARLHLKIPVSSPELEAEVASILARERIREDVYIRVTVYLGEDGSWRTTDGAHYMLSVRSNPRQIGRHAPIRLGISTIKRISEHSLPPTVKAGANYLNSRYALLDVQARGFDDALMLTAEGWVSEATGSTVFFVDADGGLATPADTCDLLLSVTRSRVLGWCQEVGIPVRLAQIEVDELRAVSGAFLVGTAVEVRPVSVIEDRDLVTGLPVFQRLVSAFDTWIRADED